MPAASPTPLESRTSTRNPSQGAPCQAATAQHTAPQSVHQGHSPCSALWDHVTPNLPLILYAFCGLHRDDSVNSFAQSQSHPCAVLGLDIELSDRHDLICDATWDMILSLIVARVFAGSMWSPPCCTFSTARNNHDGGPTPLRGMSARDIYGLPNLSPADKEKVRIGTLLAVRTAEGLVLHLRLLIPFIFETPAPRPGRPHITLLEEFRPIVDDPRVDTLIFDQCTCGAPGAKATMLLLFMIHRDQVQLPVPPGRCSHSARWWTVPWSGFSYQAPHPAIKGKQWAVPFEQWSPDMLCRSEPPGEFISRSLAAYPAEMNRFLAMWLTDAVARASDPLDADDQEPTSAVTALVSVGTWRNALVPKASSRSSEHDTAAELTRPSVLKRPRLRLAAPPTGPTRANIGGMRRAARSLELTSPASRVIGAKLHTALCNWLRANPSTLQGILAKVGADVPCLDPGTVDTARGIVCDVLNPAVREPSALTEVYAGILGAWRRLAEDPDDLPEQWLATGAPGGVTRDIEDRGIFEPYDEELDARTVDPNDLATEPDFTNYAGVEEDDLVQEEMDRLVEKRFLLQFDTLDETCSYLGGEPVLSKIGVIKKVRLGKLKRRLVLDAKRSMVSAASRKFQRVYLPRITDVIVDVLELLWSSWSGSIEEFEFFIADFADAFFHVPLAKAEQRFFTFLLRGRYYVLLRTGQGSRGAPLTWARLAALMARLTQAMFPIDTMRLNVYVDDPIMALRGTRACRDMNAAIILVLWSALGFSLSLRKAKRSSAVVWTSARFSVLETEDDFVLVAQTKPELIEDARSLTAALLQSNVVPCKQLRTLAAKVSHIGSLIFVLRPFAAELWAALHGTGLSWAPRGCVWLSQIRHTLTWLMAFFMQSETNVMTRHFSALAMFNRSGTIEIVMDASPWGIGAILFIDGPAREFLCSPITASDECILGITIGTCECQQVVAQTREPALQYPSQIRLDICLAHGVVHDISRGRLPHCRPRTCVGLCHAVP